MPIDNEDLQLFKIIYAQNPDKPMDFIQEEVLKAKQALLENSDRLAAQAASEVAAANKKGRSFVELKKSDLMLKTRAEIDAAIGDDHITCCICNRKMNSLGAHLKRVHHVDPKDYVRVCGYPEDTKLMGKNLLQKLRVNVEKAQSMRKNNRSSGQETYDPMA
ncbi:MAG: MucR family transcriptional regulator [Desulfovibrio sp.]|nr:MucR family transcriptional regulator [Desulfovibrio sp.]